MDCLQNYVDNLFYTYNIMKCLYDNRCTTRVTYSCSCTEPEGYFCEKHFNQHCQTKAGKHKVNLYYIA